MSVEHGDGIGQDGGRLGKVARTAGVRGGVWGGGGGAPPHDSRRDAGATDTRHGERQERKSKFPPCLRQKRGDKGAAPLLIPCLKKHEIEKCSGWKFFCIF